MFLPAPTGTAPPLCGAERGAKNSQMPLLHIYESDSFRLYADPAEEWTSPVEVTPEELAQVQTLQESAQRLQAILKELSIRPRWEYDWDRQEWIKESK